jgi:hypothetical protein
MGDQIKLVDLARNLIRLAGYVPDKEVGIKYTGLRPGEKLTEELVGDDEVVGPSPVPSILRVHRKTESTAAELAGPVMALERMALDENREETIARLRALVPTFQPDPLVHGVTVPALVERRREVVRFPRLDRRVADCHDRRLSRRGGRRRGDLADSLASRLREASALTAAGHDVRSGNGSAAVASAG